MGAGCSSDNKPAESKKAPTVPGLKIVLVGDCEVGKTSIYVRFLHNQFSPLYVPTNKVNIDNVVQKINQPSHALVSLTLWDVPGREEINLHSTYFRDMDALIVVADLTDETSIRMAPVWKQLALNSATVTGEGEGGDRLPGTLQPPVLLLGNKLDVIEEQLLADLQATEKLETDSGDTESTPTRKKSRRQKIQKPECVQLLESVSEKAYFTGSAVVSAKSGDGSVCEAIKSFVRHILEKRNMPRRFQPLVVEEKEKKSRDRQAHSLDLVGIPQFDKLLAQGQVLMTRVASLGAHFKETLQGFQQLCVAAKVVGEDDCSLENCLVGLKDSLSQHNIALKLALKDQFCVLEAKSTQDVELPTDVRYALKTFNKEFAAVCQVSAKELPTVVTSLDTLDARLAELCQEYKVPPPPPPGTARDQHSSSSNNNGNMNSNNSDNNNSLPVDLQATSRKMEKNRARLLHSKHQAEDVVKNVASALKKARTAFVW
ncbi:uncharacterized protein LOC143282909 [Babylonia areolata]|uniref:uncharacterized protein LOC143282909 n=1 Tax=Babylonia areolata TaxID=304850 RepID=UPI003FD361EE